MRTAHTAVYRSNSKGEVTKLSTQEGDNSAVFSKTLKYYINVYSNIHTPYVTTLCNRNGKTLETLEDNRALAEKLGGLNLGKQEFFSFTTGEGISLNGYMVKPANFDPAKKYPVIMFQSRHHVPVQRARLATGHRLLERRQHGRHPV